MSARASAVPARSFAPADSAITTAEWSDTDAAGAIRGVTRCRTRAARRRVRDRTVGAWRVHPRNRGVDRTACPAHTARLLVGASLGLAGAALQGLLRNPLAEPGIIGISACAAFGAVIAFYSGLSFAAPLALPLAGIAGALMAVVLLYALAGREASTLTLILAGVAINGFAGAATALALNLAPNPFAVTEIVFWMMGSLADRSISHLLLAAPLMILGWALLLTSGRALDALTLGEETAASLGVRLSRLRFMLVLGTALAVGSGVAVTGAVGFVGLVAPHLLRPFVAYQPSRLLVASALAGAVLVLAADIAIRLITVGPELKLGVVTALIGAPFFLVLVMRLRRETI